MTATKRVQQAINDIRKGKMVILVDDEDRENEGDLCMAAEMITPEAINFMAIHARGLICLTLTEKRCAELALPMMVNDTDNQTPYGTAFTVSVDARDGITTGISAYDRSLTIQKSIDPALQPAELVRPGHIFPLRARDGGVLVRAGQTEGSVDLSRLAGLHPSGVICEIMREDGTMARMPDLEVFAKKHGLSIVSIADMIEYRMQNESFVEKVKEISLTLEGRTECRAAVYQDRIDGRHHIALCVGEWSDDDTVMVRVHRSNTFGDVFGFHRQDGPPNIRQALATIEEEGQGVLLYLNSRQDGSDMFYSLLSYEDRQNHPTPPMDLREYGIGAQILAGLGLKNLCLLTNNPKRIAAIEGYGLHIADQKPLHNPSAALSSKIKTVNSVTIQDS